MKLLLNEVGRAPTARSGRVGSRLPGLWVVEFEAILCPSHSLRHGLHRTAPGKRACACSEAFRGWGSQKRAGWRSTRRCRSCAFESGGLYNVLHSPHMERASARLNGRSSSSGGGLGSRRADVTVVPLRSAEPMSERAHTAQENGAAWPFFSTPKNSMPNAATRDRLPCAIVTVELAG